MFGGVPGGVLDGELLEEGALLWSGGIQTKQRLPGLGPKLTPPQLLIIVATLGGLAKFDTNVQ